MTTSTLQAPPPPESEVDAAMPGREAVAVLSQVPAPAASFQLLPPLIAPEPAWLRMGGLAVALLLMVLYGCSLFHYWAPAHPGLNENGYLVGGKQIAFTLSPGFRPQSPYEYVGRMWIYNPQTQTHYPKYPIGLPLLVAGALWIFGGDQGGWGTTAGLAISPVCAALAVLGMFLLARRVAGTFAGLLAMLLLGLGQVFFTLAVRPNSHASAVCAIVWGMLFLLRFMQTGSLWRGAIAGLLIGFAGIIRYSDGLLGLCVGIACLGMIHRRDWPLVGSILLASILIFVPLRLVDLAEATRSLFIYAGRPPLDWSPDLMWAISMLGRVMALALLVRNYRRVPAMAIAALPTLRLLVPICAWAVPIALQLIVSRSTLGTLTSYDATNESTAFGFWYGWYPDGSGNWDRMAVALNDSGLLFVLGLGILGVVWMLGVWPRVALILIAWFVPTVLLYTCYYWSQSLGVQYSRFVMSALPALIVSAAWAMAEMARRAGQTLATRHAVPQWKARLAPTGVRLASAVVVALACMIGVARATGRVSATAEGNGYVNLAAGKREYGNLASLGAAAMRLVPPGSMVFGGHEDRMNHLQFVGRWQLFSVDAFQMTRVNPQINRAPDAPADPDPIDPGRLQMLRELYRGKSDRALQAAMVDLIRQAHAGGRRVFFILDVERALRIERILTTAKLRVQRHETIDDRPPEPVSEAEQKLRTTHARLRVGRAVGVIGPEAAQRYWIAEVLPADNSAAITPAAAPRPAATRPATTRRAATRPASTRAASTRPATSRPQGGGR